MKKLLRENINYFRLDPELDDVLSFDANDNKSIIKLLDFGRKYLEKNKEIVNKIVDYLK